MDPRPLFCPGGIVPLEGYVYVPRRQDMEFLEVARQGLWINIVAPLTMGKSSLVVRGCHALSGGDRKRYATVDLRADVGRPRSFEDWLEGFGETIARELGIELNYSVRDVAKAGRPVESLAWLIQDQILQKATGPVILVLDEIQHLANLDYSEDIVLALRELHNNRAALSGRISLFLVGTHPVYQLPGMEYGLVSPFGYTVLPEDFDNTVETRQVIAEGLPLDAPVREEVVNRLLDLTGGQPFLTMTLAQRLVVAGVKDATGVDSIVDQFVEQQRRHPIDQIEQMDHFLQQERMDSFGALSTYLGLLEGDDSAKSPQAKGADLLKLSGLCRIRNGQLEVKCAIFKRYFNARWATLALSQVGRREHYYPKQARRVALESARNTRKLCVINTGGTIGMFETEEGVVRPPRDPAEFMERYSEIRELADIEFIQLFNLDSINVFPSEWVRIAEAIYHRRNEGFAGFVIAHGTDTMAFSAAAVAFALGEHLSFPVVFTGAQTTQDSRHGDARLNLYRACLVALEPIPEVVVCFGDHVFRGCRAQKKDERRFDAFESPTYPTLALITEGVEVQQKHTRIRTDLLRKLPEPGRDIVLQASFAKRILQVDQMPGIEPEFFYPALRMQAQDGEPYCRGVILQTPGAGNIVTQEPYSFLPFVEEAVRKHIPVVVIGQYPAHPDTYQRFGPSMAPVRLGAIYAGHMTAAAATTKFRWLLAQADEEAKAGRLRPDQRIDWLKPNMMLRDYVGELQDPAEETLIIPTGEEQ